MKKDLLLGPILAELLHLTPSVDTNITQLHAFVELAFLFYL